MFLFNHKRVSTYPMAALELQLLHSFASAYRLKQDLTQVVVKPANVLDSFFQSYIGKLLVLRDQRRLLHNTLLDFWLAFARVN